MDSKTAEISTKISDSSVASKNITKATVSSNDNSIAKVTPTSQASNSSSLDTDTMQSPDDHDSQLTWSSKLSPMRQSFTLPAQTMQHDPLILSTSNSITFNLKQPQLPNTTTTTTTLPLAIKDTNVKTNTKHSKRLRILNKNNEEIKTIDPSIELRRQRRRRRKSNKEHRKEIEKMERV